MVSSRQTLDNMSSAGAAHGRSDERAEEHFCETMVETIHSRITWFKRNTLTSLANR